MAGFREFQTGEILTAANVDDSLAKQAVMKFADAAARDSALGTAVAGGNALREGMVAWLDDDDSVIAYDGSAWNPVGAEPPAGIGSNVVTSVKATSFSTASTTFVDVTDFNVVITPTTDTAKVLVFANYAIGNAGNGQVYTRLLRDSTAIADPTMFFDFFGDERTRNRPNQTIVFLDSPATTSATTYKLQIKRSSGTTAFFNRNNQDIPTVATFTVIEVAV
jgi:hypothetical protein